MATLLANPVTIGALTAAVTSALGAVAVGEAVARRENTRMRLNRARTLPGQLRQVQTAVQRTVQGAGAGAAVGGVVGAVGGAKAQATRNATKAERDKAAAARKQQLLNMAKSKKQGKKGAKKKVVNRPVNTLARPGPGLVPVAYGKPVRIAARGIIPVTNIAAGQANRIFQLAIDTQRSRTTQFGCLFGNSTNDMAFTGLYGAVKSLYRKYRLVSLVITFRSFVTSTSSGVLYASYDDTPSAGLVGASGIMNRAGACMQDYKRDCRLVWQRTDATDWLPKVTANSAEVNDQALGYGCFQFLLSNDQALAANVGNFEVESVLEFFDPIG